MLLPEYHRAYWLGLSREVQDPASGAGRYIWLDNSPPPTKQTYSHWGMRIPGFIQEPDRDLSCAAANYTIRFEDPPAWGWDDTSCEMPLPFICRQAPEGAFLYASNNTLATYLLNTTPISLPDAQASCIASGGMLVAYAGLDEQAEVEAVFEGRGNFIPAFHGSYWMGLSTSSWPDFSRWMDGKVPMMYEHWGNWTDCDGFPEPNNIFGDENCVAANSTEAFEGVYGWSDAHCSRKLPFVCKIIRGCRLPGSQLKAPGWCSAVLHARQLHDGQCQKKLVTELDGLLAACPPRSAQHLQLHLALRRPVCAQHHRRQLGDQRALLQRQGRSPCSI